MWIVNDSNALIIQNLFYANTASQGGAIYLSMPSGSTGPVLVNNTIVGGSGATQGSAVWAGGFDSQVYFYNNLLIGLSTQNAVYCDATYSSVPPVFTNNDAYSPVGSGLEGTCASEQGESGNISANPLFVNASKKNYQLQSTSTAINAGAILLLTFRKRIWQVRSGSWATLLTLAPTNFSDGFPVVVSRRLYLSAMPTSVPPIKPR